MLTRSEITGEFERPNNWILFCSLAICETCVSFGGIHGAGRGDVEEWKTDVPVVATFHRLYSTQMMTRSCDEDERVPTLRDARKPKDSEL